MTLAWLSSTVILSVAAMVGPWVEFGDHAWMLRSALFGTAVVNAVSLSHRLYLAHAERSRGI